MSDEAEKKLEPPPVTAPDPKPKLYQILIDRALRRCHAWHNEDGEPFVDIRLAEQRKTWQVPSREFRAWLRQTFVNALGFQPTRNVLDEVESAFVDLAISGPRHKAYHRIAPYGDDVLVDLANDRGEAIRVGADGWSLTSEVPVRFVRGTGTLALPIPVSAGKLPDLLRPFMPVKDETDLVLVVGWLIGCFKPAGPFPVLIITGEQGSAKSTFTRVLRRLVDPHSRDMREPPKDPRDLVAAVRHSYVVAFDNVSYLTNDMSDRLCALSTGTRAIGGRALFTDHDEAAFTAVRPLILNGITDFVERGDLADRAISIHLPAIPPDRRMDDDTFWEGFSAAQPAILGAILDGVSTALRRYDSVQLAEKPRMANFCRWAVASEPAMTFPAGTFLAAMLGNRADSAVRTFTQDPVGSAVLDLMAEREMFHGDIRELANELAKFGPVGKDGWPKNERMMAAALRRLTGPAGNCGIVIKENGTDSRTRRKKIEISRLV